MSNATLLRDLECSATIARDQATRASDNAEIAGKDPARVARCIRLERIARQREGRFLALLIQTPASEAIRAICTYHGWMAYLRCKRNRAS